MSFKGMIAFAAALVATSGAANAAVVVNIAQSGTSVVATTSGTLNLTGLTSQGSYALDRGIIPANAYIATGNPANAAVTGYSGFSGPTAFGTRTTYLEASSGTGIAFAINGSNFGDPYVFVTSGYISGSTLSGTSTFSNQTFASLGLTIGSYVFRSANDTVTVNVGSAVPELGTWAMMILGMGAVGFALRSAKRRSDAKFDAKIQRITAGLEA